MNHEQRIKKLEAEVSSLKDVLKSSGLLDKFVRLSVAAEQLNINDWVIRRRIRNDPDLVQGKHYIKNGTYYKINVEQYRKLMAADAKAMHQ